jgi:hypothetical protein
LLLPGVGKNSCNGDARPLNVNNSQRHAADFAVMALIVFSAGTMALRCHADAVQTRAVAGSSMAWLVASEPFREREPEAARTRMPTLRFS